MMKTALTVLAVIFVCWNATSAVAALRPDELLLIYNANVPESRQLAEYYAKQRAVPADRLCPVAVNAKAEQIERTDFEKCIREPIRQYLREHHLQNKVRCLVTFYGLPIRIGALKGSPVREPTLQEWKREYGQSLMKLQQLVEELDTVGSSLATRPTGVPLRSEDLPSLTAHYGKSRVTALNRILKMSDSEPTKAIAYQQLVTIGQQIEGVNRILAYLKPSQGQNQQQAEADLKQMRAKLDDARQQAERLLAKPLDDPSRREARSLIQWHSGLLGLLAALQNDIDCCQTKDSVAAVDSELMLLWWDNYPLTRWVFNTLSWRCRSDLELRGRIPPEQWGRPVLMVSRLDGPSEAVVRRMIADAIVAEHRGLQGTTYLDARGIVSDQGLGRYDRSLCDLANLLWKNTPLPVRLDTQERLFGRGECPDAMLYCGWYSVRQYVPAFSFVPGSIAYHLGSFEAVTLKEPKDAGWCKGLLNDGVAATLGPVAEPYLESFPLPEDFLGLLLTGRYSLVECYSYTSFFNSWMLMLLGDPLYRPFAANPRLTVEQVFKLDQIPPEARITGQNAERLK